MEKNVKKKDFCHIQLRREVNFTNNFFLKKFNRKRKNKKIRRRREKGVFRGKEISIH